MEFPLTPMGHFAQTKMYLISNKIILNTAILKEKRYNIWIYKDEDVSTI